MCIGCQGQVTTSTGKPTPTVAIPSATLLPVTLTMQPTASLTSIPTPTPPAVMYDTRDTLRELPLNLGAVWVYSKTDYETVVGGEIITVTLQITDTVIAVERHDSMVAARVRRTTDFAPSSQDPKMEAKYRNNFGSILDPKEKWVIVDGNKVYEQWELNWNTLEQAWLAYIFPLHEDNHWYPDPEQRAQFSPYPGIPGVRIVDASRPFTVPAGRFENCFHIAEHSNSGGDYWFCPTIGLVAEQYDHAGTPFGYRLELIRFSSPR